MSEKKDMGPGQDLLESKGFLYHTFKLSVGIVGFVKHFQHFILKLKHSFSHFRTSC